MKHSKLTVEARVALYTKKKLSIRQIAKLEGISWQAVHASLKRAGVAFRGNAPDYIRIDKTKLKRLYVKQKLTIGEIAAELKLTRAIVSREIDRHGIAKRLPSNWHVKYPALRKLKIGKSIELPRPNVRTYSAFHEMAQRANIRVRVHIIDEQSVRVTRIA